MRSTVGIVLVVLLMAIVGFSSPIGGANRPNEPGGQATGGSSASGITTGGSGTTGSTAATGSQVAPQGHSQMLDFQFTIPTETWLQR